MDVIRCIQVLQLCGPGYNEMTGRIYSPSGIAPTIRTYGGGGTEVKIVDQEIRPNGGNNPENSIAKIDGKTHVLSDDRKFRVRKLTQRETWRLMDFSDEDYDKVKAAGISDTQLYKQAGNSIVVAVLEAIFKKMI